MSESAGARFRSALTAEHPLQIVGTINANHALIARKCGFKAIYLSGGGVAAGSLGVPDLAISNLDDVLTDTRRITDVCDVPLIVDADTGFGPSVLNIARTTKALVKAGAAALHIEDQSATKKCGHLSGKELVSIDEMLDRIRAAVDARTDPNFVIIARTDALSTEGLTRTVERVGAYVEAGADMIFPEAVTDIYMYEQFCTAVTAPILANLTEFGMTPLFTLEELAVVKVDAVLYPLSAFRAMNRAAENVYQAIRREGTQRNQIDFMQTRAELYDVINYTAFEKRLAPAANGRNCIKKQMSKRNDDPSGSE